MCRQPANQQCPECVKIGISVHFCGKVCFKSAWSYHKFLHIETGHAIEAALKEELISQLKQGSEMGTSTCLERTIQSSHDIIKGVNAVLLKLRECRKDPEYKLGAKSGEKPSVFSKSESAQIQRALVESGLSISSQEFINDHRASTGLQEAL